MKGLHGRYLFVALDLPKQMDLLFNLLFPPNSDHWEIIILNHYVVNNAHCDPLQECIHKEACRSFRGSSAELSEYVEM